MPALQQLLQQRDTGRAVRSTRVPWENRGEGENITSYLASVLETLLLH